MKRQHDKTKRIQEENAPGDLVLLNAKVHCINEKLHKLAPQFLGPYEVVKTGEKTGSLNLGKNRKDNLFNVIWIKKFYR
jgi:hypothetical protein